MKEKFLNFCRYIWSECKDKRTLALLIVVLFFMYSPVWLGYLLYFIFKWKWCVAVATAYLAFWAGPLTPFFPLCIAITFGIKRLLEKFNKIDSEPKNWHKPGKK